MLGVPFRTVKTIALVIGLLAAPLAVADERDEPGDMFVRVYVLKQETEKMAARDATAEELKAKYKEAAEILAAIKAKYPTWQPLIVDFRQRQIAEALKKLGP